jgi:hypothetical protein
MQLSVRGLCIDCFSWSIYFFAGTKADNEKTQFLATPFIKSMALNDLARMARSLYLDTLFELVLPIT